MTYSGIDRKVTDNVERVVTKPEASATYTATRFGYAFNGRAVTFAVGETWDDASVCPPVNYQIMWAREFRYDGARARYLNRQLDPVALMSGNFVSLSDTWTDYDGDSAYGDFEVTLVNPPTVTNRRSYQPGLAQVDPWRSSGLSATDYVMGDHLGTTRGLIDSTTTLPTDAAVYTAFGERISGTNHRFGYVGSFGYQASGEYPFLHVGARYYDPGTGRFLQRDPIGIRGGLNVYAYSRSAPTLMVDPDGMRYQLPNFGPPPATGPSDEGMFDPIWTPVHYSAGYLADMLHIDFMDMLWWAIWYEEWEPNFWPGYRENLRNQYGDLISACIGWIDSHF